MSRGDSEPEYDDDYTFRTESRKRPMKHSGSISSLKSTAKRVCHQRPLSERNDGGQSKEQPKTVTTAQKNTPTRRSAFLQDENGTSGSRQLNKPSTSTPRSKGHLNESSPSFFTPKSNLKSKRTSKDVQAILEDIVTSDDDSDPPSPITGSFSDEGESLLTDDIEPSGQPVAITEKLETITGLLNKVVQRMDHMEEQFKKHLTASSTSSSESGSKKKYKKARESVPLIIRVS